MCGALPRTSWELKTCTDLRRALFLQASRIRDRCSGVPVTYPLHVCPGARASPVKVEPNSLFNS